MAKSTRSHGGNKRRAGKAGWPAKMPKGGSPRPGKSGGDRDEAPSKGKNK